MVEQESQSVVGELAVATGDPLGVLDFEVEVLGGPVAHRGVIEVRAQLGLPGVQGAAQASQLVDRALAQVGDQLLGAAAGLGGIGELLEGHEVLGHGPGQGDLTGRISGDQPGL